jgi:hypothetical protein
MTKDDIIRMAREAGIFTGGHPMNPWSVYASDLERFAALVVAAERNRKWTQAHWTEYERSIAAAEREACVGIIKNECLGFAQDDEQLNRIIAAIQARGEK